MSSDTFGLIDGWWYHVASVPTRDHGLVALESALFSHELRTVISGVVSQSPEPLVAVIMTLANSERGQNPLFLWAMAKVVGPDSEYENEWHEDSVPWFLAFERDFYLAALECGADSLSTMRVAVERLRSRANGVSLLTAVDSWSRGDLPDMAASRGALALAGVAFRMFCADRATPRIEVWPVGEPLAGIWTRRSLSSGPEMLINYGDGSPLIDLPSSPAARSRATEMLLFHRRALGSFVEALTGVAIPGPVVIHLGDGYGESDSFDVDSPQIAFAARSDDHAALIPDLYAMRLARDVLPRHPLPFQKDLAWKNYRKRMSQVYWRGTLTGPMDYRSDYPRSILTNPRVRFVSTSQAYKETVDAKLTGVPEQWLVAKETVEQELSRIGAFGSVCPETSFWGFQAYVDLDGNRAAWGTLAKYWAMCLVLKPPFEWKLAYYDRLESGRNYISINDDEPGAVAAKFLEMSASDRFEVAYEGHLMAVEYLCEVGSGNWSRLAPTYAVTS